MACENNSKMSYALDANGFILLIEIRDQLSEKHLNKAK